MHVYRLIIPALASLAAVSVSGAQHPGRVEIGAFGQFTVTDPAWRLQNGWGFGARLGYFLTHRWELQADVAQTSHTNGPPRPAGTTTRQTYAGRVSYNIPFGMGGRYHEFQLSGGVGGERVGSHTDLAVTPGGGLRFALTDNVSLRLAGIVDYVINPADDLFAFPTTPGRNLNARFSTNVDLRAGLSFM